MEEADILNVYDEGVWWVGGVLGLEIVIGSECKLDVCVRTS